MRSRTLTVVLVIAVVLSGCAGFAETGDPTDEETTTVGTDAPTATSTETSTDTSTATPTSAPTDTATGTSTDVPTATPTPTWTEPRPPNKPKEGKYNPENPMQDEDNVTRLYSVELANVEEAESGDGYVDFDAVVRADTRMENVDPPEHGDVEGEPYFLIYADEELIYRSEQVEMKNGTWTLDVHPGSLDQFEEGRLDLRLILVDRDSEYDDEYAFWQGTVEYAPE